MRKYLPALVLGLGALLASPVAAQGDKTAPKKIDHDVIKLSHTFAIYDALPNAHLWILPNTSHSTFSTHDNQNNGVIAAMTPTPLRAEWPKFDLATILESPMVTITVHPAGAC